MYSRDHAFINCLHSTTHMHACNVLLIIIYLPGIISTTSRLYIGVCRCLSIFHVFSLMFKLLYLCRERPDQETNSLFSLFCAWMSHILWSMNLLMNEYCHLKNCTICTFTALCLVSKHFLEVQPSPGHSAQGFQTTTTWIRKQFFRFAIAFTTQMTSHARLFLPRQFRHL